MRGDIQCHIHHHGFTVQSPQKDTAVQGCITGLLKGIVHTVALLLGKSSEFLTAALQ